MTSRLDTQRNTMTTHIQKTLCQTLIHMTTHLDKSPTAIPGLKITRTHVYYISVCIRR